MTKIPFTTMTNDEGIESIKDDEEIIKSDVIDAVHETYLLGEIPIETFQVILMRTATSMLIRTGRIKRNESGGYEPNDKE